jgi:hypothetical protein
LPPYAPPVVPQGFSDHMHVGAMWQTIVALEPVDVRGYPLQTLRTWVNYGGWQQSAPAPISQNSLLMYAGEIRLDERASGDRIVSVPRHTFIVGNGRYIITEFSLIRPVTD